MKDVNKPIPPAYGGGVSLQSAVSIASASGDKTKLGVDHVSDEVAQMAKEWDVIEPLMGGTEAVRAAGKRLLPKHMRESDAKHEYRISVATLFPALSRTVKTLASKPFSKPATLSESLDKGLSEEQTSDCDLFSRSVHQFGFDVMSIAMSHGIGGILVDYKRNPGVVEGGRAPTKAEDRQNGMRPYLVIIRPRQVLGWRSEERNGSIVLTQLRYRECVKEPAGLWAEEEVEQIRVLEPGKWSTWRKPKDSSEWVEHESGTTTMQEIPYVPFYGDRTGFMTGRSPLLDLAHLNVKHLQSQSDQDNLLHTARVPILTLIGVTDEDPESPFQLTVGSGGAVRLPAGADLKYVEHTGAAIEAGKKALDDLKEEMRQSGAELLVLKPGPVTATEVASDNSVGMCDLQRISIEVQTALNRAIELMAEWEKTTIKDGDSHIKLFMDFGAATLAEASASLLLQMSNTGKLSNQTLFSEFKRRGIIAPDVDYDDEQERLDAQGPSTPALPGGSPAPGKTPTSAPTPAPTPKPTPAPTPAP